MSTSPIQPNLIDATRLQKTFAKAHADFEQLPPASIMEQITQLHDDADRLAEMQEKVEKMFKSQGGPLNNNELLAIADKLKEASAFREKVQVIHDTAVDIALLAVECQEKFGTTIPEKIDSTALKTLQDRVQVLSCKTNIGQGNIVALHQLQAALSAIDGAATTSQPSLNNPAKGPYSPTPEKPGPVEEKKELGPTTTTLSVQPLNISQAIQLLDRFTIANAFLDNKQPEQVVREFPELAADINLLTEQKETVASLIKTKQQSGSVPYELYRVISKLREVDECREKIQAIHDAALAFNLQIKQFQEKFGNLVPGKIVLSAIESNALRSLKERAVDLSSRQGISQGNLSAFLQLRAFYSRLEQGEFDPRMIACLSTAKDPLVLSFPGQFNKLEARCTHRPSPAQAINYVQEFTRALEFYNTVRNYSTINSSKLSIGDTLMLREVLRNVENLMLKIIDMQAKMEEIQTSHAVAKSTSTDALQQFRDAFNNYKMALDGDGDLGVLETSPVLEKTYKSLTTFYPQEIHRLFDQLYSSPELLDKRPKNEASMTVLPFLYWHGTPSQKLEAIDRAIAYSQASPSASIVVVKKADEMRQLLEATREKSRDNVELRGIKGLTALLPLLEQSASVQDLQSAHQKLAELRDGGVKMQVEADGKTPALVADRVFYQLYCIHKIENFQLLKDDIDYGNKAMAGIYPASNAERRRAVQRTLAEASLQGLVESIGQENVDSARDYLKILEDLKLDAKDLPQGMQNLAHQLFGALYQNYLQAWEGNRQMVHPHDGAFQGDFGRNAFNGTAAVVIPKTFKMDAINQLKDQLKLAWKI